MGGKVEHPFKIQVWAGDKVVETLAIVTNVGVAIAAFDAAVRERPGRHVTLRHGARVIRATGRVSQGPPTVGHLKSQQVQAVRLWCLRCGRSGTLSWEMVGAADDDRFPEVGRRLRCSACGGRDIQKMPDWPAQSPR
ncbi:MAG: hypothetical protein FD152_392 [Xanthobacteraceae bacterium]|nr:MAG: hypothetical protein FD152_392 [Xanthobacteraceae bacterium]